MKLLVLASFAACVADVTYFACAGRCENRTRLRFAPELRRPGVYRIGFVAEGYRAGCTLRLSKREVFGLELEATCGGDELWFSFHEKAVTGIVVPRALKRAHVEVARGSTLLYDGDVTPELGSTSSRACEYRSALLELTEADAGVPRP